MINSVFAVCVYLIEQLGFVTGMGYQLTEEDLKNIDDARLMSGIKSFGYDVKQLFKNLPTAKALKSGKDFALDLIQKAKDAARARVLAK